MSLSKHRTVCAILLVDMSDSTVASDTFSPSNCQHFPALNLQKVQQNQSTSAQGKGWQILCNTDSFPQSYGGTTGIAATKAQCFLQLQGATSGNKMMHALHPAVKMFCSLKASATHTALCSLQKQFKYPYRIATVTTTAETNSYMGLWALVGGPAVRRWHHNLYLPENSLRSCAWGLNWMGRRGFPCWHGTSVTVHMLLN